MPATQTVFLKHTFLNKASQARPYTARAHSRYIARRSATQYHYVENMPLNYQERQRWYHDMEKDLRKNGRVIDKFTLSVPKIVRLEHAAEVTVRLNRELGDGRAPFEFSLQGWGTSNHHAHVIYVDRDPDTGRRIFGTTNRNSTREIKLEWERVANQMFEELGYDVRVKVKEGWEEEEDLPTPDELGVVEIAPLSPDSELDAEDESVEADEDFDGDDDMADKLTAEERVGRALELWEEHRFLTSAIRDRDDFSARYEVARQRAEEAALSAASGISVKAAKEIKLMQANERYEQTHRANGKAKGIRLAMFGRVLWESNGYREAMESEARLSGARSTYELAVSDLKALNETSERLSVEASELLVKAEALERHVRVMGTEPELAAALTNYQRWISEQIGDMTLAELVVMVEEGEISPDQCEDMLRIMGRQNDLEEFQQAELDRKQEMGESL